MYVPIDFVSSFENVDFFDSNIRQKLVFLDLRGLIGGCLLGGADDKKKKSRSQHPIHGINDRSTHNPFYTIAVMKFFQSISFCTLAAVGTIQAYSIQPSSSSEAPPLPTTSRRSAFQNVAALAAGGALLALDPLNAAASGGATAGKYTTIPIAKRRYYGRVQAGVHDFLLLGPEVVKANMGSDAIQSFFDPTSLVVVEARNQSINGQCTKKDGNCRGAEVRDSPYNDMKTSMYLLANAFRINQQKSPDALPTVKAAKAFFKEIDAMEKR
eukprot:scaffold14838_cov129-Cylindrotheca_fusiformis.AAC.1